MGWMLFRKHKGGHVFFSEGFRTESEARAVAAHFAERSPNDRVETIIEQLPDMTVKTQLDALLYREELTQAGPQLVIPGCERETHKPGSAQLSLFA